MELAIVVALTEESAPQGTLDTELVLRVHLPTALMDTKVGFRILNTCEYVSCGIQVDPWC